MRTRIGSPQLRGPDQHAVLVLAVKVPPTPHAAVMLAQRQVEAHARPLPLPELRRPEENHFAVPLGRRVRAHSGFVVFHHRASIADGKGAALAQPAVTLVRADAGALSE